MDEKTALENILQELHRSMEKYPTWPTIRFML